MIRRVYDYLQGWKGIVLILYTCFIIGADVFISDYSDAAKTWLYLLIFAFSVLVCPAVIRLCRRLSLRYKAVLSSSRRKVLWFSGFLLISMAVFGLYYAANYPGAFSADSFTQYKQAITGEYNNWHPVLHTLLGFTLPLSITGGWIGSIVLFQLIAFSFAAAYAAYTILRHSSIPYALLSLAYILLSPCTAVVSMYPWKDVPFAITALLAASYAANAWFTKGEWLKKRNHIAAVVIVLVLATVFRHNALLFTLPMLIALILYLKKKAAIITAVCFVAAIVLIEGPLYAALRVEQPGDRQTEMLGVPMSVIGTVAARNPQALDEDIKRFVYSVAPAESWTDGYVIGNFNTVKFRAGSNYHKVGEEGAPKVIGYMLRCFVKSPKEAFTGLLAATDMAYTVTGEDKDWSELYPGIIGNEYGVTYQTDRNAKDIAGFISTRLNRCLKWLFWDVGVINLIMIVAALSKLRFRKKAECKRILPVLSMLLYNFGTMLLLSGEEIRLFFYTFPVMPVLLLLVMREEIKERENAETAGEEPAEQQLSEQTDRVEEPSAKSI